MQRTKEQSFDEQIHEFHSTMLNILRLSGDHSKQLADALKATSKWNSELLNKPLLHDISMFLYAVMFASPQIVACMIRKGADPKSADKRGFTTVHCAIEHSYRCDRREVLALLLQNGADANAKTNGGITPLELAIDEFKEIAGQENDLEYARLLLTEGASLRMRNINGDNPREKVLKYYKECTYSLSSYTIFNGRELYRDYSRLIELLDQFDVSKLNLKIDELRNEVKMSNKKLDSLVEKLDKLTSMISPSQLDDPENRSHLKAGGPAK